MLRDLAESGLSAVHMATIDDLMREADVLMYGKKAR